MFLAWSFVGLVLLGIWLSLAFLPWFDVIVRRTNKHYPLHSVVKHDGAWYRVVMVKDRFDALFGEKYSDVFLRRLKDDEAAVHEVDEIMTEVLHPKAYLMHTGAPFYENGRPRKIIAYNSIPDGHHVFSNSAAPYEPGSRLCCHDYQVDFGRPDLSDPGSASYLDRKRTWTVVSSLPKDWGKDDWFKEPGTNAITYDVLVVPDSDVPCPLCLIKEVMES